MNTTMLRGILWGEIMGKKWKENTLKKLWIGKQEQLSNPITTIAPLKPPSFT